MKIHEPVTSKNHLAHQSLDSSDIRWIGQSLPPADFGWKAARLGFLDTVASRVPHGFAISKHLVSRIATNTLSPQDFNSLRAYWTRLVLRSSLAEPPLIVRSSSTSENPRSNSFAGLFQTIHGLHSLDEVTAAVRLCHAKAQSTEARTYSELRKTHLPDVHIAVIVQFEIDIRQSALIQIESDRYLFEAYNGNLASHIRGIGPPDYVIRFQGGRTEILQNTGSTPTLFFEQLRALTSEVQTKLATLDPTPDAILETATDGRSLFVLQVNLVDRAHSPTRTRPALPFDPRGTALEDLAPSLGFKAAAMAYFQRQGFFGSSLLILPAGTSDAIVAEEIERQLPERGAFTVRFSCGAHLGLPRAFHLHRLDLIAWILSHRQHDWTTIVHPYIDVRSSFEALIDSDSVLLEHVPGMWESDNTLDPDVVLIEGQSARAWRCTQSRPARLGSPSGWRLEMTSPLSESQIVGCARRLSHYLTQFRIDFRPALPVNLHFVEDATGNWHFINVRRGFDLDFAAVPTGHPHVVSSATDLDTWDGKAPLLLRLTTARGSERTVLSIAQRLPRRPGFAMLVEFGLLSHPAMILRELGFLLVPTYLYSADRLQSPSYGPMTFGVNDEMDPIVRLRQEPIRYSDSDLRILDDRDPIVPGHRLVLAEGSPASFADSVDPSALTRLLLATDGTPFLEAPWVFVERGRATFCSSGFMGKHAHGHILPVKSLRSDWEAQFVAKFDALPRADLRTALAELAQTRGEYILMVGSDGRVRVGQVDPSGLPKRALREFFTEHRA